METKIQLRICSHTTYFTWWEKGYDISDSASS